MKVGGFTTHCAAIWKRYKVLISLLGAVGGISTAAATVVAFNDDRYVREVDFKSDQFKIAGAEQKLESIESQLESFQRAYTVNRLIDRRSDVKNRIREIERRIEGGEATPADYDWLDDLRSELDDINAQLRARGFH